MLIWAGLTGFSSHLALGNGRIRVVELKGKATQLHGTTEAPLSAGAPLKSGSVIRVSKDSVIFVSLGHDVVAKIGGGSEATLIEVDGKDWELNLKNGIAAAAVRNPDKRPNHFRLRTRSAVMGVRGTVFYVEAPPTGPVFVCTCTGTVAIDSSTGKSITTVTASHHDHPLTLESGVSKPAPMGTGHSDADVTYLQKLLAKI